MDGERIKQQRLKLNLTQEQLGKILNTSRSNVANWENNQNYPSLDMLFKLSDLFGCSVGYLADQTDSINDDDGWIPKYEEPDSINLDEMSEIELLLYKNRNILTDSDKAIIKTIIEQRQKEIDKELGEK